MGLKIGSNVTGLRFNGVDIVEAKINGVIVFPDEQLPIYIWDVYDTRYDPVPQYTETREVFFSYGGYVAYQYCTRNKGDLAPAYQHNFSGEHIPLYKTQSSDPNVVISQVYYYFLAYQVFGSTLLATPPCRIIDMTSGSESYILEVEVFDWELSRETSPISQVSSTNPDAYPDDGLYGDHWYVKRTT